MSDYNSSLTGEQIEQTLLGAVLSNKSQFLTEEQKAQARKNIGAGTSDSGLRILGYYATAKQLETSVPDPKTGDAYAVGTAVPYDIYIWDAVHRIWVNNGNIRGADGKDADLSDAEPMKHKFTDVRIAPAAYVADETYPDFPFRATIPLGGINETMTPCVTFDVAEAIGGIFAPVAECYNGGVYIYAESALNYEIIIPTIICWEGVYAIDDPAAEKLILSYDDLRLLLKPEVDAASASAEAAKSYAEDAKAAAAEYAGAGYHNSVYRGNFLGNAVTAEQFAAIKDGTFDGLYIGDYWTIGGVTYRIAAFDYYYSTGDNQCDTHHVTLIPGSILYVHKMNESNTTTGAYVGSKMYTEGLSKAKEIINAAFGSDHILKHRKYLNNAVTNGCASGGSWYDSTVELMTEQNLYGGKMNGNAENGNERPDNSTIDKSQYPLFAFRPDMTTSYRNGIWLRDVSSAYHFCYSSAYGIAMRNAASLDGGVRPAFSIIG